MSLVASRAASLTEAPARPGDRTFEAVVFGWEGTAVADRHADAGALRERIEALCRWGVHLAVVSAAPLQELDDRLRARPEGPGTLRLCVESGARVFDVGPDGPTPRWDGATPDPAAAVAWVLADLAGRGIGSGLTLIVGSNFGAPGGTPGPDARMVAGGAARATVLSVGEEPDGVPAGVAHEPGGPDRFLALLDAQLARRAAGRVPSVDEDPAWTVELIDSPLRRRIHESLTTLADGRIGVRGAREEDGPGTEPLVVEGGLYANGENPRLLAGPVWTGLVVPAANDPIDRLTLDLRTGVLSRERRDRGDPGRPPLRTLRFVSIARPGVLGLRAEGAAAQLAGGQTLTLPSGETESERGAVDGFHWARTRSSLGGGITIAAREAQQRADGRRTIERLAVCAARRGRVVGWDDVVARLREATGIGFDRLIAEHREAWARRWEDAAITIDGDDEAQLAARFALFHLLSSAAAGDECAVGARGLSGQAYGGHVFWDAEVFVLPVLAATNPGAARAMLEYRVRRLPAARAAAAALGLAGARFPWESAHDGTDVTPHFVRSSDGAIVPIRTGQHEDHISADVAWGACQYAAWSGDTAFLAGPGRALLTDTARYWVARARDGGPRRHLYGVVGPDEYHEIVDDNAFTNGMARWNLRRAASLVERDGIGATAEEAAAWRETADALIDGYDPASGCYEQFAGYWKLESLLIDEVGTPPVAADVLLGRNRVMASQIIKQADVLMLHHLVPDEVVPGSLGPNLAFYEPRTAHGSSLSPAVHAALLARAGQPDRALDLFRVACRIDLDDLTNTTAAGLHMATMGGVWQALVFGFAGVRVDDGVLRVDPHLPTRWRALEIRVRVGGRRVRLRLAHDAIDVRLDGTLVLGLPGGLVTVDPPGRTFPLSERREP